YEWTVPNVSTAHAEVRVQAHQGGIPIGYSATPFTINAPITNVSPGANSLFAGMSTTISWTQPGGFDGHVAIDYSTDGRNPLSTGFNRAALGGPPATIPHTENVAWTVPNKPTAQAMIRIVPETSTLVPTAFSAPFTIIGATTTTVQSDADVSSYGQSITLTA